MAGYRDKQGRWVEISHCKNLKPHGQHWHKEYGFFGPLTPNWAVCPGIYYSSKKNWTDNTRKYRRWKGPMKRGAPGQGSYGVGNQR